MRRNNKNKENQRYQHRCRSHQIGRRKREMLRQHTAREDADAETQIPSGEVGGCGRATLSMGTQVDEQSIEGWESRAETQTTAQSYQ